MIENKAPDFAADARIFTLGDIRKLFLKARPKILIVSCLTICLVLPLLLVKLPKYKIQATFKDTAMRSGSEFSLKDLLGATASNSSQGEPIVLMQSYRVLKPLIERLGLQIQVANGLKPFTKIWNRSKNTLCLEFGYPIKDPDPFRFENVCYEGEKSLQYDITFQDSSHFSIAQGGQILSQACVGQEVILPNCRFTLTHVPQNMELHHSYGCSISGWARIAQDLRSQIQIVSLKTNKAVYDLTMWHQNRQLGAQIVNGLMEEYQRYLQEDHDVLAAEQLVYLESKQNQILSKISEVFDDHVGYLTQNIQLKGVIGLKDEIHTTLLPMQQMMQQSMQVELELARLSRIEKDGDWTPFVDDSFFSRGLQGIAKEIAELKQQRDLFEICLQQRQALDGRGFEEKRSELAELRSRRQAAKELLSSLDRGERISQNFVFHPEKMLSTWANQLEMSREDDREDFAEYLDNHIRLLCVQEKMLQERLFYIEGKPNLFEGIDLPTVRALFVEYNSKLDACTAQIRHLQQLQKDINDPGFELSCLTAILRDPLSQKLIEQATLTNLQFKDEKYRSDKEGARWTEEIAFQKKILKGHLEQLHKVEEINGALLKEKIDSLQEVGLDCVYRQISVLNAQAVDAIKDRKVALVQEKRLLEGAMASLKEKLSVELPEKWRREKSTTLRLEMAKKMMEKVTELVESKTIGHRLHHIESKPLDLALLPLSPNKPRLITLCGLSALVAGFGFFFLLLVRTIFRGFPVSLDILKAMRLPVLGEIASTESLETLRQIALFCERGPGAKIISLLSAKGPDYSTHLAANLARKSLRSLVIRCDFSSQPAENPAGLLQGYNGTSLESCLQKREGFDLLSSGGFTPYGLELVQSSFFQDMLHAMKKKYDLILLFFSAPLSSAASEVALKISDKAVATVSGEKAEELTSLVNWAYHEGSGRLTFVVSDFV